jgi:hypothetical protein
MLTPLCAKSINRGSRDLKAGVTGYQQTLLP